MEEKKQRVRRSKEERIAEINAKIERHQKEIRNLEAKKEKILNPAPRTSRVGVNKLIKMAKEQGLSTEEIAKKLNIEL